MTKAEAAAVLLKNVTLEATVNELQKEVATLKSHKDMYYAETQRYRAEIDSVNAALDSMKVPRKIGTDSWAPDMTISARLFAWLAGAKVVPNS